MNECGTEAQQGPMQAKGYVRDVCEGDVGCMAYYMQCKAELGIDSKRHVDVCMHMQIVYTISCINRFVSIYMPGIRQGSNHTPDGAASAASEPAVNGARQSGRFPPWRPRVGAAGSCVSASNWGVRQGKWHAGLALVGVRVAMHMAGVCVCAGCGWGARGSQLPDRRPARPHAALWYQRVPKGRT